MSATHDAHLDTPTRVGLPTTSFNAEVDELLADLEERSARETSAERFYPKLLDAIRFALNGHTASFWRRAGDGLRCEAERLGGLSPEEADRARPAPRRLLAVLAGGEPASAPLGGGPAAPIALVCPVAAAGRPLGVLVGVTPASPLGDAPLLGVLAAFGELAEQFELRRRLANLEEETRIAAEAQSLALRLQGVASLHAAARTVAEEGRRLIGADRLTIAVRRGGRWRVAAVSGVERPSRRSNAVRAAERLLGVAMRTGDTVAFGEGPASLGASAETDLPPQLAAALQEHVESGQARDLRIVPCRLPAAADNPRGAAPVEAALLVEQFEGRLPERWEATTRLVSEQAAAAFGRLQTGGWRRGGLAAFARRVVVAGTLLAALGGAVAALVLVPAELRVVAEGRLAPVGRARVFAPMDATVDRVLVAHGETVAEGQELVELRCEELEIDLEQARAALATTRSEIAALETAKLRAGLPGFQGEADLSAITSRIESLAEQAEHQRRRVGLLGDQQARLVVVSPMAGRVVSWRPNDYLGERPVRRGQRLLEVAAVGGGPGGEWTLELDVPDHRSGPVLTAAAGGGPLLVDYVIKSDTARQRRGCVVRIAPVTQADAGGRPVLRVDVRPLAGEASAEGPRGGEDASLRSGATVLAKVRCGQHSLGYVWFHEAWEAIERAWF